MLYDEIKRQIRVHKSVYKPLEDARMLGKCVEEFAFGRMLDMGCGTGIQGIIAARKGCDVTFSDINPRAIECARENASLNRIRGRFVVSDVFSDIREKFNTITFNPPFLATRELDTGKTDPATDGGIDGREVIDVFLENYGKHLLKNHVVFMTESYWNDYESDVKRLHAKIAARKHYPLLGDCVVLKFR